MFKKTVCALLALLLTVLVFTGCGDKTDDVQDTFSKPANVEVSDLQLVLLNSILYNDSLTQFEGRSIEGHGELIDDKYENDIAGGHTLLSQLNGFTLVDYDYGDVTGFKAAAFTKGSSLVLVYGGTDHWTDFVDDIFAGLFDFSAQDGQAKAFAKDNIKKYSSYDLYITGYSMGGRLCYLGTEDAIDNGLGNNLKKVRTFNGLGVKEVLDLTDGNLSNIHNLEVKFGGKTYDYFVDGDMVSDKDNSAGIMHMIGYHHVGTEIRVPCTNETDVGLMKQHDLYSIIDYLLGYPKQTATAAPTVQPAQLASVDFLIGDWSTSDGVYLSFYEDGTFEMQWSFFPAEEGTWHAEPISENKYDLEMDGSTILSLMSMIYGSTVSDYHFEILKSNENSFYLVQVYGDYTAESSPCKLPFTRN